MANRQSAQKFHTIDRPFTLPEKLYAVAAGIIFGMWWLGVVA